MTTTGRGLLTAGHGTADQDALLRLFRGAQVGLVVDVRRFPGSRRHPHVTRETMAAWLADAGIDYRWDPRLGGRRGGPAARDGDGPDPWWRVAAFRGYAAHARSPEFVEAMADLLADLQRAGGDPAHPDRTVVLCSETLWWRCHRRIISDVTVLLHGVPVEHLGHDGRCTAHPPAAGARVTSQGLVYDRSR